MQVSLYLNDGLVQKISDIAKARGVPVSGYIAEFIEKNLGMEYSPAFLSSLGSLADVEINRPEQPSFNEKDFARFTDIAMENWTK